MPVLANQSGYCNLQFDVDAEGHTFNVEVGKCTDDMFAESAANSVRKWLYSPKLVNGQAVVRSSVETRVTFKLTTEEGDVIEEPEPVDESINDVLGDDQKAKLATEIPEQVQVFSTMPTSNYCCVRYDISQTGAVFNEDVVTCSDFKLHDDSKQLIRVLQYTPANYNGKKISSGGYTMLIKYFDFSSIIESAPKRMMPVIGSKADESTMCQFD